MSHIFKNNTFAVVDLETTEPVVAITIILFSLDARL